MLEILTVVLFVWLSFKAVRFMFRLTWGIAKVIAGFLMAIAVPVLVICLLFLGGISLLVPIALVAIAAGILKACL